MLVGALPSGSEIEQPLPFPANLSTDEIREEIAQLVRHFRAYTVHNARTGVIIITHPATAAADELEGTMVITLLSSWDVPRLPDECHSELQAALLRLLLSFLQHERLAEHSPVVLEEMSVLETIGSYIVAEMEDDVEVVPKYTLGGSEAKEYLDMEIPDDKLEETFMFEFELDGGAHYDLYWTCVNDWDGDFVGQTGCVRNISGSSLFAAKMCDWMDDY